MNTIATITGQAYRAAYAVAPRKDIRPYLNGIRLDVEAGKIVATDGHIMYINDVTPGDTPGDSLTFEPVKIPAGADTVEVVRHDEYNVMLQVSGPRTGTTMHVCKTIAGMYPDYNAVIPKTGGNHRLSMGFDVKYLAVLKQIFKHGARFTFSSAPGATKIVGDKADEGMVVLMELRT